MWVVQVMFICNHCPFVKHLKKDIVKLANFYMKKGLAVVAISSNSVVTHPQDGPEFMAEEAKLFEYPFPYLYDEDLCLTELQVQIILEPLDGSTTTGVGVMKVVLQSPDIGYLTDQQSQDPEFN
ncbi:hypothetical protein NE237_004279 [Protea cynaroides]|uniref:Thioredoxin-dependent peroxiredoxin n=1 Tax=Protea cynaroides TaxID=273540 RepID=A0A9Q0KIN2_9MAGN|nr:hypothetical protein NE237_004279 [Protea cynaroides]